MSPEMKQFNYAVQLFDMLTEFEFEHQHDVRILLKYGQNWYCEKCRNPIKIIQMFNALAIMQNFFEKNKPKELK
jgi:hypothetical protein